MARILLLEDGNLRPIESAKFEQEGILQDYLEQYPELLPFHEVEDSPPPLITIGREVGVPSGSIDLLYIDTSGRLTLIETKLVKNSEIRREVVGQIIEYASFVAQWDSGEVERRANQYLRANGGPSADLYRALADRARDVEPSFDPDACRHSIEENLRKGNIRLVIAVDELIEPLRATVSFLNDHCEFDFLILQLRKFVLTENMSVFIPPLFGYSRPPVSISERRVWFWEEFFSDAEQRRSKEEVKVIRALYEFAVSSGRVQLGTGAAGSFAYRVPLGATTWITLFIVFNAFGVQIGFGALRWRGIPVEVRVDLLNRLNAIPGIQIAEEAATEGKYPSIPLALSDSNALKRFTDSMLWLREQVATLAGVEEAQ